MDDPKNEQYGPAEVACRLIMASFPGDIETAKKYCTEDLVLRINEIQTVTGHEGLQQLMEFNEEFSRDVSVQIHHALGSGNHAAVSRTTHLTINGTAIQLDVGAYFTLRDGLVCEWTDYQDMRAVTRALGH